jgi:predicted restriction endonuclease
MTHQIPPKARALIQSRDTICGIWACMVMDRYGKHIGGLEIHHIKTYGSTGEDDTDNMITLCHYHHWMAQQHLIPESVLYNAIKEKQ